MSSSNASTAEVDAVNYSTITFIRFWYFLLICLGTIGHPLSIYVFTRPRFRSNSCVRYFFASIISGVFVTYANCPLRLLQSVYNIDVIGYSIASCKILTFLLFGAKALTSWLIALASIDRFLCSSTSVAMRALSNVRIASRAIFLITIVIALSYIYVPIQYKLVQTAGYRCPTNQGPYPAFNGIWNLIIFSLGPPIVMLIFGSLTIKHVRQSVRRVGAQSNQTETQTNQQREQLRRQKTTERQLIQMMIVQCIYFSLTSAPVSIYWIYGSVRASMVLDALQLAKDNLFFQIAGTLCLTGASTSFYLFILSSELFRGQLMTLFNDRWQQNQQTGIPLTRRNGLIVNQL